MDWSAAQYVIFENERTRPVRDLLAAVPADIGARRVVDLGCGPGNSTELLSARFPGAAILGLNSSPDMIAAARRRLPQLRFDVVDIAQWRDQGLFDVILANAVLHWLPDHEHLLPALVSKLRPGGALAIQMPDNLDTPTHRLMRDTAMNGPWSRILATAAKARTALGEPAWYYERLLTLCSKVDIWHTTYYHRLAGTHAVVEWFRGSALVPFLEPLNVGERGAFLAEYTAAVARAYAPLPDGSVLLPFPRLFMVGIKEHREPG